MSLEDVRIMMCYGCLQMSIYRILQNLLLQHY